MGIRKRFYLPAVSFTFHYVSISMFNILMIGLICYIYIPLCFYFNYGGPSFITTVKKFTFHYVSISIGTQDGKEYTTPQFTFHYVSISISTSHHRVLISFPDLHSIMFLFQFAPASPLSFLYA